MVYGAKLSECCETVIAAMAAHIERLEIDLEMKDQANNRLREENRLLKAECASAEETVMKLKEQLDRVESFCTGEPAQSKPLYTLRSRPAEFIKTAEDFKKASDAVVRLGKFASETANRWASSPGFVSEVTAKAEFSADPFDE